MISVNVDIFHNILDKIDNIDDILTLSLCNKKFYYTIVDNKIFINKNDDIKKTIYDKINMLKITLINNINKKNLYKLNSALKWIINPKSQIYDIQNNYLKNIMYGVIVDDYENGHVIDNYKRYIDPKLYNPTLIEFLFYSPEKFYTSNRVKLLEHHYLKLRKYITDEHFFRMLNYHLLFIYKKDLKMYINIINKNIESGNGNHFYYQLFDIFNTIDSSIFLNQIHSIFYKNGKLYDPSKYENFNIMDADGDIQEYCSKFYEGHMMYNVGDILYLKEKYNF